MPVSCRVYSVVYSVVHPDLAAQCPLLKAYREESLLAYVEQELWHLLPYKYKLKVEGESLGRREID